MNATCSHFKILITGHGEKRKRAPIKLEERGKALSDIHLKEKRLKEGNGERSL